MTTIISKLKVGDRLSDQDSARSKYGFFSERYVTSIQRSKSGRYMVKYSYKFTGQNGETTTGETKYTHLPVVGHTPVNLYE